jgi:hypothetical protein
VDGVQIFSIILGIAGITGGATGYFAKSRGDTVISLQGKEIESLERTNAQLEKDKVALSVERDSLKIQNDGLILKIQGSPELAKIVKEIHSLTEQLKVSNGKS